MANWLCKIGVHKWLYAGFHVWHDQRLCKNCGKCQLAYHPAGFEWYYVKWQTVSAEEFKLNLDNYLSNCIHA